jgi:hypothetical protein
MNDSQPRTAKVPAWAPVDACTLPTAERPLRVAEFDALFRDSLTAVERPGGDTRARLLLAGDGLAERVRRLADAESACCSFFTFGVSVQEDSMVALDIEVPSAYAAVLAGLLARAEVVLGRAS